MILRKIMLTACIGSCSVLVGAQVKVIQFPEILSDGKPAVLNLSEEEPISKMTFADLIAVNDPVLKDGA
jgi:hypothetical protein